MVHWNMLHGTVHGYVTYQQLCFHGVIGLRGVIGLSGVIGLRCNWA